MATKTFITVYNGVITSVQTGDIDVEFSPNYPYFDHERIEIPSNVEMPIVGAPVDFYDENWNRKPDSVLVQEKLRSKPKKYKFGASGNLEKMTRSEAVAAGDEKIPAGKKLIGDEFMPMTTVEKINAGIVAMPEGMKIVGDQLQEMQPGEKVHEGLTRMPAGYRLMENLSLFALTDLEKVTAGLKTVPEGKKVDDRGEYLVDIPEPTDEEKLEALKDGDPEAYQKELARVTEKKNKEKATTMINDCMTNKICAFAEINAEFAALRLAYMQIAYAQQKLPGWPGNVTWPNVEEIKSTYTRMTGDSEI